MALDMGLVDDDIKDVAADYNGDLDFRTDEAQFGYIEKAQYLLYLKDANVFRMSAPVDDNAKKERARFIAAMTGLNVPGLGGNADAVKYAYLRAKLVAKGVLYDYGGGINGDRHVYTNEAREATQDDINLVTNEIKGLVKAFLKTPERAFIDKYWRIIVSICAHVLAVRSHHYKEGVVAEQSYDNLYNRLWRACAIDDKLPFNDLKKLFRTTLHPFGLVALADVYQNGCDNHLLPRTLLIRIDAMPAGAAKPGTALAVINLMRAASWFPYWFNAFKDEIQNITVAVAAVRDDRYKYHVANSLYGKQNPTTDEKEAYERGDASARALAPYLVGYVSVECEGSPIQNQMTLRQASDDQIGLKNRFMRFLTGVGRKVDQTQDITAMLPAPEERKVSETPPKATDVE